MGPVDWVVLIMTTAISISLLTSLVATVWRGEQITPEQGKRLEAITTAMLAIVALYIGNKLG